MLKILNEYYYLDLDALDDYVRLEDNAPHPVPDPDEPEGHYRGPEAHIHLVKYETVKLLMEVILVGGDETIDETLGERSTELTIPFKLAFNTLLNKKIINKF